MSKTINDLKSLDELTEEQSEIMWQLLDRWYKDTDTEDLLEMSGIIDTPIDELE